MKEQYWIGLYLSVVILVLVLIIWGAFQIKDNRSNCEAAGGAYIKGYCIGDLNLIDLEELK